jgi:tape measure domain-containing protein
MATTVETLITEYKATIGDYEVKTRRVIRMTEEVGQKATEAEKSIQRMNGAMMAISAATNTINGTIELFGKLAEAVRKPFDAAVNFDRLMRGLEAVAGSSQEAQRQFERLKEVAKAPGLGLPEAIEGSIRLQSAGISAKTAERALKAFGTALATVGRGKAELDGVTMALTQIQAKGKVSAEEINQLAERLPQIRRAMEAAFGTSNTEVLQKMGLRSEQFIEAVITQFEKLKPISGSISNDLENVGDKITIAFASAGRVLMPFVREILPRISQMLDQIIPMFDRLANVTEGMGKSGGLKAFAQTLVGDFQRLNSVIAATVGILAGLAAGAVVVGLIRLAGAFFEVYKAIKSVSLAAMVLSAISRNWVGIVAALTALTVGALAFNVTEQSMKKAWAESPVAGVSSGKGAGSPESVAQNAMAMATAGATGGTSSGGSASGLSASQVVSMVDTFIIGKLPQIMAFAASRPGNLTAAGVDAAVNQQKRADEIARLVAASPEWMKNTWGNKPVDALTQIERNTKAAALGMQNLSNALFGGGPRASLGLSLADIGPQAPSARRGSGAGGQIKIELGTAATEMERVVQRTVADTIESLARQGVIPAPALGNRLF